MGRRGTCRTSVSGDNSVNGHHAAVQHSPLAERSRLQSHKTPIADRDHAIDLCQQNAANNIPWIIGAAPAATLHLNCTRAPRNQQSLPHWGAGFDAAGTLSTTAGYSLSRVSTVAAMTIGADRSVPFTNSIVLISSGRFGLTAMYRNCRPCRSKANLEPGTSTRRM